MGGKHGDSTIEDNIELTRNVKIILIILFAIIGVFGVLSPRMFNIYGRKITYANLCSSGVLFSAGLVHLLGEAVDSVNEALPGDFSWGYLLCALSFYLIFVSERFMELGLEYIQKKRRKRDGKEKPCHCNLDKVPPLVPTQLTLKSQSTLISQSEISGRSAVNLPRLTPTVSEKKQSENIGLQSVTAIVSSQPAEDGEDTDIIIDFSDLDLEVAAEVDDHHHGGEIATLFQTQNYMAAMILMFGLGLHSAMAGFALGASKSSSTVISIGIAIVSHKYLEAFSLGCPLHKARMSIRKHVGVAVFFAALTPLGMAVGWGFGNQLAGYIGDLFVCMTSGMFLYISIVEIMIPEFSHHHAEHDHSESEHGDIHDDDEHSNPFRYELYKIGSIAFGFIIMTVVSIWA